MVNQFDYGLTDITTDSGRIYVLPDGTQYPSVTTVLGHVKPQGIIDWEERIGLIEADRIRDIATSKGSKLHDLVERYLDGQKPDHKREFPDVNALFFKIKSELDKISNIVCQEAALYSDELKIAGRVDCVGKYNGQYAIIDFKTASKPKKPEYITSYCEQITGYGRMFYERTGINIRRGVIIMASPIKGQVFKVRLDDHIESLKAKIEGYYQDVEANTDTIIE